ncbi:hypothetical protein [Kitasatospora purpeofusca]|uniref:hypothetical protein n=1 Tax=Kitasatospora purpeofusca TaxID=67352 RepID=UPI0036D37FF6
MANPGTGNPTAHEADLAASLTNLAIQLSEASLRAEALDTATEAVAVHRRLADPGTGNPTAHQPDLAIALSNLGRHLAQVGRHTDALEASKEAVAILRRLADPIAGNPAAYARGLASSLATMGLLRAMTGNLAGALYNTGEAVAIHRDHIASTPDLLPDLRGVLGLQARVLDDLGRRGDAAAVRRWLHDNPLPVHMHG